MKNLLLYYIPLAIIINILLSSCITTEIKDGATAYRLKKYALATTLLQADYEKENEPLTKAGIAYQIGESYRAMADYEKAGTWYKNSWQDGYGFEARYWYARMLQSNEQYQEAVTEFRALIQEDPA